MGINQLKSTRATEMNKLSKDKEIDQKLITSPKMVQIAKIVEK